jgi:hypothetical protein
VEHLLVANTTQIVNSTLNNNEMVKIARKAASLVEQIAEEEAEFWPQRTGTSDQVLPKQAAAKKVAHGPYLVQ